MQFYAADHAELRMRAAIIKRICIVTGASAGIGREVARALARQGDKVILLVRDRMRGESVHAEISAAGGIADIEIVDLASQRSIRAAAKSLRLRYPRMSVLINNAGVWRARRELSPDGIELTWAINVLGYYLLTELLLPALQAAGTARVINIVSSLAGGLDINDVQFSQRRYDGRMAYAQSKQADRLLTWALARRLTGSGITANAVHPGFTATEIFAKSGSLRGRIVDRIAKVWARHPADSAAPIVWLATSAESQAVSDRFYVGRRECPCEFRKETAENELAALCSRMTAL